MHFSDHCVPFQTPSRAEQTGQETNIRRTSPRIRKAAARADRADSSASAQVMGFGKKQVFPRHGQMFETADLVHEGGMFHQISWRRGVVYVRIGNHRDEIVGGVLLVVDE